MPDELDITSFQSSLREWLEPEDKKILADLIESGGAGFQAEKMDAEWVRQCEALGLVFRMHEAGTWIWATGLAKAVVG